MLNKILQKLLKWIPVNLAGLLGIVQAALKCLKEILTVIVNILFPIIPSKKFKDIVTAVRNIVNKLDEIVQKIKDFFLKAVA